MTDEYVTQIGTIILLFIFPCTAVASTVLSEVQTATGRYTSGLHDTVWCSCSHVASLGEASRIKVALVFLYNQMKWA